MTERLAIGDTVRLRSGEYQAERVGEIVGVHEPFVWIVTEGMRYPETYHRRWVAEVLLRAEENT